MWKSNVIEEAKYKNNNRVVCKQFCDTEKLYLKKMNSLVRSHKMQINTPSILQQASVSKSALHETVF